MATSYVIAELQTSSQSREHRLRIAITASLSYRILGRSWSSKIFPD
ncbi:hypothetical protein [Methanoregula sp.]